LDDGWAWCETPVGNRRRRQNHRQMKHATKPGKVSISHSARDFGPKSENLRSILRQAGMTRSELEETYFRLFG